MSQIKTREDFFKKKWFREGLVEQLPKKKDNYKDVSFEDLKVLLSIELFGKKEVDSKDFQIAVLKDKLKIVRGCLRRDRKNYKINKKEILKSTIQKENVQKRELKKLLKELSK